MSVEYVEYESIDVGLSIHRISKKWSDFVATYFFANSYCM